MVFIFAIADPKMLTYLDYDNQFRQWDNIQKHIFANMRLDDFLDVTDSVKEKIDNDEFSRSKGILLILF
jgi:hypothetical protein